VDRAYLESRTEHQQQHTALRAFVLETTNIVRKYAGVLDVPLSSLSRVAFFAFEPLRVYRAMQAHASQLVWFRKLFIVFSRYTCVNTFQALSVGGNR